MFEIGDVVKIKEAFLNPNETGLLYKVVDVNTITKRCFIELLECDLPLSPQELVSFDWIDKVE